MQKQTRVNLAMSPLVIKPEATAFMCVSLTSQNKMHFLMSYHVNVRLTKKDVNLTSKQCLRQLIPICISPHKCLCILVEGVINGPCRHHIASGQSSAIRYLYVFIEGNIVNVITIKYLHDMLLSVKGKTRQQVY